MRRILALAAVAALFFPMARERYTYLTESKYAGRVTLAAYESERGDIEALLARLQELQTVPGRVHTLQANDWQATIRVGVVPLHLVFVMAGIPATSIPLHSFGMASALTRHVDESSVENLAGLGARYIVTDRWLDLPETPEPFGRFRLYRVPGGAMFSMIQAPGRVEAGQVADEARRGETYSASVLAYRDVSVVFRSSYHQGMRAAVDGKRVPTSMTPAGMLAFPVPFGAHRVKVWYQPMAVKYVLLFAGIFGVLGLWLFQRKTKGNRT